MMNNSDLDSKLRSLRVPERDPAYWEMFPRRVVIRAQEAPMRPQSRVWFPRVAWGFGVGFALLLVLCSSCPGLACPAKTLLSAAESLRSFHGQLSQLPNNTRALVRIDHGLHSIVEEQP